MKIIDKYLSKTFLKSLMIATIVFLTIICITYIFDRIDVVFRNKAPIPVFLVSLLYSLPSWISLIFPVAALLATLFSIGELSRNNEISALRTSGMSILTISKPIIIIGLLLTFFFIFFNNTILIKSNRIFNKIWSYEISKHKEKTNKEEFNIVQIEKDSIFSARIIDGENQKITGLILLKFDDKLNIISKITSKHAIWKDGYLELNNASIGNLNEKVFEIKKYASAKIQFEKKPSEFINIKKNPNEMSYKEISSLISRLNKSGIPSHQETLHKYSKIAKPFAILIMVVLGIPFAIKTAKTAKIFSFTISIFTGFVYWGMVSIGFALGMNNTLNPFFAAWIPNIIFLILASYLIHKTEK
ncbi:MAG: hypothetical protein A2474_04405 [Elusimicrobia bacterium RIFOXYC2_FULL_34_12]|nr:MAG: hypothetical protein A2474_04405 [Elusimicrobia bacterium RIFOXYC2_FULL_34_12]OGS39359.1 MAG: hypothetical protein A2551_01910 [Elusimicrobia bacterium RIFOXYD2_FULL_34_30]